MARKLFKIGGLDVTVGKAIAAGVVVVGLAAGTCMVNSRAYDRGRNSVVDSDASVEVAAGAVKTVINRPDRNKSGYIIGSTEYTVVVGRDDKTQVLDVKRYDNTSAVYTDSNLADDDSKMDGRVDIIEYPELGIKLVRTHDYVTNKPVFDNADDELEEARARFSNMD